MKINKVMILCSPALTTAASVAMHCKREKNRLPRILLGIALAAILGCPSIAHAADPLDLGTAANFRTLAGAAISGTGHVEGDVGSGAGAIAPAITSTGTIYDTGDAVVMTALDDFATAYNEGKNLAHTVLLSAAAFELGGKTLTAGVYKIGAAATLASPVTLNAQGNPDAVFIIKVVGAFGATAAVGNVVLANGARSENVFWIIEGAVSMGAGTHMEGTILGGAAIAFGAGTTINGRAMAGSGAGTIALAATAVSAPPLPPAPLGDRVWLDLNGDGIQDPAETGGIDGVPVALLEIVSDGLPIDLGAAADFGALAGGAISGTGNVDGDVGSGTGAIAAGITSEGTKYPTGDAVVMTAINDFATAYTDGKNRTYDVLLSAAAYEMGGTTLKAGTYKIGAAATLASPVALNAEGDPDAVFVIQIVGAFGATAGTGNVVLTNGAQSRNVFWVVEGAVSIGAFAHMEGTILGGAAITFGANASINGRALAGSAAGTVALANDVSTVPGTPPVIKPPTNVIAQTVTDANGNYLFGSVQPGIYVIRWDLSSFTSDYRISEANQGGDDALDSDGVSGDVGGFVYTEEFAFPGGTPNLDVDFGMILTLPAIQATASGELTAALGSYLVANDYTAMNWTALNTARTDGDIAINAATDPAGVAAAKAAALAAMNAVPTFDESLAAAQAAATGDLSAALGTYMEADYTAENWTALNTAKANGEIALNAATEPADVAAAKAAALAAMDAVPTIAGTLAAAQTAALSNLTAALVAYLSENDFTPENWAALITAKVDGEIAINAATDPAGVTAAQAAALAALGAVPTFDETLAAAQAAATGDLSAALGTYLEADYTAENWTALSTAKTDGVIAINAATDPAGVAAAKAAALAAMDAVPTVAETLVAAQTAALEELAAALAALLETNYYTPENWAALIAAKQAGDAAINAATDLAGVETVTTDVLQAMDEVDVVTQNETAIGTPLTWYEIHEITPEGDDDWNDVDYYDSDGDTVLNWQEYLAGTDPNDSQSVLKIVTVRAKVGEPVYLEWIGGTAGPLTPYVVESSLSLRPGDWESVGTRVRIDGINDWTGQVVLPGENRFFRVVAPPATP